MRKILGAISIVAVATGLLAAMAAPVLAAKTKGNGKSKGVTGAQAPPPRAVNACGCYADSSERCFCGKKGKCACPGECEPKGCEEKRAKQMNKEIAAETKKAADAEKKQHKSGGAAADKSANEAKGTKGSKAAPPGKND